MQQESEFFDFDKADYGLVPVHCDVWSGFIFVNLDRRTEPDAARVPRAEIGKGLEGYPFEEHDAGASSTARRSAATGSSSWTPSRSSTTHRFCTRSSRRSPRIREGAGSRIRGARTTSIDGPHRMVSSWGGMVAAECRPEHGEADGARDAQRPVRSVGRARPRPRRAAARASTRRATRTWGLDSFQFLPNFVILIWKPNWVLTYHYWPTSYNTHIFEGNLLFRAAEERARTPRAGDGRRHVQGVRAAGRQHARGDADHARVAHAGDGVPAQRPGDPAAPSPPHGAAAT